MQGETQAVLTGVSRPGRSYWAISLRRLMRKKVGVACLSVIVVMYGAGILSPLVTPYGYNDQNLDIAKQPPPWGGAKIIEKTVVATGNLGSEPKRDHPRSSSAKNGERTGDIFRWESRWGDKTG